VCLAACSAAADQLAAVEPAHQPRPCGAQSAHYGHARGRHRCRPPGRKQAVQQRESRRESPFGAERPAARRKSAIGAHRQAAGHDSPGRAKRPAEHAACQQRRWRVNAQPRYEQRWRPTSFRRWRGPTCELRRGRQRQPRRRKRRRTPKRRRRRCTFRRWRRRRRQRRRRPPRPAPLSRLCKSELAKPAMRITHATPDSARPAAAHTARPTVPKIRSICFSRAISNR